MTISVLLVADDDDSRWSLRDYLRGVGMKVLLSRHAVVQDVAPMPIWADVAVVDVRGTTPDAIIAAARMREAACAGIILMVQPMRKPERLMGLSLGVDHYLDKPVDPHELEVVIRNLVVRWQQRQ